MAHIASRSFNLCLRLIVCGTLAGIGGLQASAATREDPKKVRKAPSKAKTQAQPQIRKPVQNQPKNADNGQKATAAKAAAEQQRRAAEAKIRYEAEARLKADAARRAAEEKLKYEAARRAAEAKAEADRKMAEARTKAEAERRAAEAKAKAEAEYKAAEAKKAAERQAADARAKAETEYKAAEAKKAAERQAAEARAKAEAEYKAAEAKKAAEARARSAALAKREEAIKGRYKQSQKPTTSGGSGYQKPNTLVSAPGILWVQRYEWMYRYHALQQVQWVQRYRWTHQQFAVSPGIARPLGGGGAAAASKSLPGPIADSRRVTSYDPYERPLDRDGSDMDVQHPARAPGDG
jgi:hypothetical protein